MPEKEGGSKDDHKQKRTLLRGNVRHPRERDRGTVNLSSLMLENSQQRNGIE